MDVSYESKQETRSVFMLLPYLLSQGGGSFLSSKEILLDTLLSTNKFIREEMGFTDVVEEHVLMPINGWPLDPIDKEIGQFAHLDAEKFVPGTVRIMLAAGITQEELPGFLESVKYDFADARLRIYWVGE